MFGWLLKFDSKFTLNKTKQSLSVDKAKSALKKCYLKLEFLSKLFQKLHIFTINYILFQKYEKVEVFNVFEYIEKLTVAYLPVA